MSKTALVVLSLLAASVPALRVGAAVTPGMTLDQSTADQAKDLLPPEIYDHYKKGEYTNAVVDFPTRSSSGTTATTRRRSGTGRTDPVAGEAARRQGYGQAP